MTNKTEILATVQLLTSTALLILPPPAPTSFIGGRRKTGQKNGDCFHNSQGLSKFLPLRARSWFGLNCSS